MRQADNEFRTYVYSFVIVIILAIAMICVFVQAGFPSTEWDISQRLTTEDRAVRVGHEIRFDLTLAAVFTDEENQTRPWCCMQLVLEHTDAVEFSHVETIDGAFELVPNLAEFWSDETADVLLVASDLGNMLEIPPADTVVATFVYIAVEACDVAKCRPVELVESHTFDVPDGYVATPITVSFAGHLPNWPSGPATLGGPTLQIIAPVAGEMAR